MKNLLFSVLFIFINITAFSQNSLEDLEVSVKEAFESETGEFALAFKMISKGEDELFINADESFHAASTMKTPVMIEIFKQAHAKKISLDDSLEIKNEFTSIEDGSSFSLELSRDDGEHLYEQIGAQRSIRDLVTDMVIYSSNLATNIVIGLADAEKVNESMRELGAKNIQVLRGVEDMKAYDAGKNNTTTARDLQIIFEALAKGKAVSPEADKQMLDILRQQKHTDLIPALLPDNLKIANKTGWIDGVHHDSALLELPEGKTYVLVLLSKNMEDMEAGTAMLAEVSKMVYDFVKAQ